MNGITLLLMVFTFSVGTLLGIQLELEYQEFLDRKKLQRFNAQFPTIEESMRKDGWVI